MSFDLRAGPKDDTECERVLLGVAKYLGRKRDFDYAVERLVALRDASGHLGVQGLAGCPLTNEFRKKVVRLA